jgi:hypothetical protein
MASEFRAITTTRAGLDEIEALDNSELDEEEYTLRIQRVIKGIGASVHTVALGLLTIPFRVYDQEGHEVTEQPTSS